MSRTEIGDFSGISRKAGYFSGNSRDVKIGWSGRELPCYLRGTKTAFGGRRRANWSKTVKEAKNSPDFRSGAGVGPYGYASPTLTRAYLPTTSSSLNLSGGNGLLNKNPCASSQSDARRKESCSSVSTPSATVLIDIFLAIEVTALMIARSSGSVAISLIKDWSILSF